MIMYFILILICILIFVDIYDLKCPRKIIYFSIVWGLILISAFRYRLGIDSIRYEENYSDIPTIFNLRVDDFLLIPYEPLWIIFCSLLRSLNDSFFFLQLIHAIIINWIFCSFLYKHVKASFIALFFYTVAMYFLFNFESIRESLAIAIFLMSWEKSQNNPYLYYIVCLVCFMIHYGAIVLFLVPFVKKMKLNLSTLLTIIIVIALTGIFIHEFLLQLNVSFINPLIDYKFKTYISREGFFSLYTILIYFLIPFTTLISWILFVKRQCTFPYFVLLYFVMLLGSFGIPIFLRFANYFLIFYIVFLTDFSYRLIQMHVKTMLRSVWGVFLIITFSFPYLSWFFVGITNVPYKNYDRYFPYINVISKEVSEKRELIKDVEFL